MLKVFLETNTPFIFSRAAAMYAPIPEDLEKVITETQNAMIVDFAPQQEILAHPSVGAMVTHGGANSTFEIIMAGVVGVFWPFAADQPVHAAYLTENVSHRLADEDGPSLIRSYRSWTVLLSSFR